jgi:flagellar export protein FliJ
VKAFVFRLDQALRWRETEVNLQKARLAGAAANAARTQAALDSQKAELAGQSVEVTHGSTGTTLESYAGYAGRSRVQILRLQEQTMAARKALDAEMNRLIAANQKVRLLEKLRETEQVHWQHEFDRELSAFADEAFLSRSVLSGRSAGKLQSKKRTGA